MNSESDICLRFSGLCFAYFLVGPRQPLLVTVKRRKLARFRHVLRHDSLSKTFLQDTLEGRLAWSAEEILDGQRQREDILVHARTDYNGLLQKRQEEDPVGRGFELNMH